MTKQRFRAAEPLDLEFYGVKMRVAMIDGQNITIEDADLDVDEARALRDWLNKVLSESSDDEPTRKQALDDLVRLSEEVGGYDLPVKSECEPVTFPEPTANWGKLPAGYPKCTCKFESTPTSMNVTTSNDCPYHGSIMCFHGGTEHLWSDSGECCYCEAVKSSMKLQDLPEAHESGPGDPPPRY